MKITRGAKENYEVRDARDHRDLARAARFLTDDLGVGYRF
jgi:hypothetical protein